MINTANLTKAYRTDEVETVALSDVTLEITSGEFVSVMGPSGCGKSTLLNILGMLDNPSSGSYRFGGTEVADLSERQRARLRKGNIGFVFQSFNLIDELSVFENVELPLLYLGVSSGERKERVQAALDLRRSLTVRPTFRSSFRAASSSVWRSRERSWPSPGSFSRTSRRATSTRATERR